MDINSLLKCILEFRDERDWQQFHKPNHLAAGISIEAAELLEHFLWKNPEQVSALKLDAAKRSAIAEQIADVVIYGLLLTHEMGLKPVEIIQSKLAKNADKYPVAKARSSAKKCIELNLVSI